DVLQANGETRIWLPYGNTAGQYFALSGLKPTDPEPGSPPALVHDGQAGEGQLVLKFRFDRPIESFRLAAGRAQFTPAGASAGFEYSPYGKRWQPLVDLKQGGNLNRIADPDQAKAGGLNSTELYIRFHLRGATAGTRLRARMGC